MFLSASLLRQAKWPNVVRLANAVGIRAELRATGQTRERVIRALVVRCNAWDGVAP
jgi:hypothetical protein